MCLSAGEHPHGEKKMPAEFESKKKAEKKTRETICWAIVCIFEHVAAVESRVLG